MERRTLIKQMYSDKKLISENPLNLHYLRSIFRWFFSFKIKSFESQRCKKQSIIPKDKILN